MDPDLAIVVDNASSDGSAERASPAGIRLIRNPDNRGFARAANQGIAATEAPMILLLSPDAEVVGGSLEALVKVARERPQAGAIGVLVRNPDGSIQPSARRVPRLGEALAHAFLGPVWRGDPRGPPYTMAARGPAPQPEGEREA